MKQLPNAILDGHLSFRVGQDGKSTFFRSYGDGEMNIVLPIYARLVMGN